MEASPLTQQSRPETFQPKIVQLYETLFKVCPSPIYAEPYTDYGFRQLMMLSLPRAFGGNSSSCGLIAPSCMPCWTG